MKHTNKKVLGGSDSPMTQLKQIWRTLPEDERERWRGVFISNVPTAEIREKIRAELNVALPYHMQLCRFRDWDERDLERQELEEGMKEDFDYWEERFGSVEARKQARNKFLACSYARAFRYGDYQSGFRAMRADCRDRRLELAVHNSSEAFKDEQVRALEFCLDDAAQYPEVKEKFQVAFAALKEARNQPLTTNEHQ